MSQLSIVAMSCNLSKVPNINIIPSDFIQSHIKKGIIRET